MLVVFAVPVVLALPVLVTFVHAHVTVDAVLSRLRWDVAYTLACCLPGRQLSREHVPVASGSDAGGNSPA